MCSADVSKGICPAFSSRTWQQVVLSTVRQHTVVSSCRPPHEGSIITETIIIILKWSDNMSDHLIWHNLLVETCQVVYYFMKWTFWQTRWHLCRLPNSTLSLTIGSYIIYLSLGITCQTTSCMSTTCVCCLVT